MAKNITPQEKNFMTIVYCSLKHRWELDSVVDYIHLTVLFRYTRLQLIL